MTSYKNLYIYHKTSSQIDDITYWIKNIAIILILFCLAMSLGAFLDHQVFQMMSSGIYPDKFDLEGMSRRHIYLKTVLKGIEIMLIVLLILWVYFINILDNLRSKRISKKPYLTILYFFIPLFNLVKPYLLLKKILNSFLDSNNNQKIKTFKMSSMNSIILVWWILLIFILFWQFLGCKVLKSHLHNESDSLLLILTLVYNVLAILTFTLTIYINSLFNKLVVASKNIS